MAEAVQDRRKRIIFRCWHRGTRELDLLLGRFAEAHIQRFTPDELDRFEALIENSDPDIYCWISGRDSVPPAFDNDVFAKLKSFVLRVT